MPSSSRMSSLGSNGWGDDEEQRKSPIPYREGPLDYEPAVICPCGKKAARWISWSDENPGRRYFKCYRARDGGCDLYVWYEGPHDPFVQTLLIDLRNAVWGLRRKNRAQKEDLKEAREMMQKQEEHIEELDKDVMRLLSIEAEKEYVEGEMKKVKLERMVLRAIVAFI
ncbi:hypothetical protein EJB05_14740, partial [Eragrostis curvula]